MPGLRSFVSEPLEIRVVLKGPASPRIDGGGFPHARRDPFFLSTGRTRSGHGPDAGGHGGTREDTVGHCRTRSASAPVPQRGVSAAGDRWDAASAPR